MTPSFGLIIIGDEIMSGKRSDKHMPKVIELLTARGLNLTWAEYVGDSPERITATLKRTFATDDLVFSFGGIGATDHLQAEPADDLSLQVTGPQAAAAGASAWSTACSRAARWPTAFPNRAAT